MLLTVFFHYYVQAEEATPTIFIVCKKKLILLFSGSFLQPNWRDDGLIAPPASSLLLLDNFRQTLVELWYTYTKMSEELATYLI